MDLSEFLQENQTLADDQEWYAECGQRKQIDYVCGKCGYSRESEAIGYPAGTTEEQALQEWKAFGSSVISCVVDREIELTSFT